jgi:hypothetical protein
MTEFKPSVPYNIDDLIKAPNPLTRWDRVRMFFGFERKSPATCGWKVVDTHSSNEVICDLVESYSDADGWRATFRER